MVGFRAFRPVLVLAVFALASPAKATFHFMQIEQVIGGVNGDTTAQAIQLRMRSASQNLVSQARIRVFDAAGANPVLLIDIAANVPVGASGRRVLIASPNFVNYTSPGVVPDFTMTNLIPASYLAAGSLTFESDGGIVYWRLSWGGASYTGSNAVNVANDADGNAGPPVAFALPSQTLQAVQFTGVASAASTSNSLQYAVTAGAAVWTNNALGAFTTVSASCPGTLGDFDGDTCLTALDIQDFIGCALTGNAGTTACDCADINNDAALDPVDIDELVDDLLVAGPCP